MEREKPNNSLEFLHRAVDLKLHTSLDPRQRNLLGVYFGFEASAQDLAKIYSVTKERIRQILNESLEKLWNQLPDELKIKYPKEEAIQLRKGHTTRSKEKFASALRGRPSPHRGTKYNQERKDQMSEITRKLWKDPTYSEKTLKEQEEYRKRRYGKASNKKTKKARPKAEPLEESLIKRSSSNDKDMIYLPEVSLQNLVESFVERERKRKRPVTVDDVCDHLQFLGVNFEQQQIINIVDR